MDIILLGLLKVDLTQKCVDDKMIQRVLTNIAPAAYLTTLRLNDNDIGAQSDVVLFISDMTIDVDGALVLCKFLVSPTCVLESLSLAHNVLGHQGGLHFAEVCLYLVQ